MSTLCSPFSSHLIASNFRSILIVFHQFVTWIAVGDADLCALLMLFRIASAIEEETK